MGWPKVRMGWYHSTISEEMVFHCFFFWLIHSLTCFHSQAYGISILLSRLCSTAVVYVITVSFHNIFHSVNSTHRSLISSLCIDLCWSIDFYHWSTLWQGHWFTDCGRSAGKDENASPSWAIIRSHSHSVPVGEWKRASFWVFTASSHARVMNAL